ncbi:MAG: GDP-L-fucose synthase [bacterium]|jgi:GDP-L-fucose synthase
MNQDSKIFVAGHNGLVGSAIVRQLKEHKFTEILTRSRQELDLTNQTAVADFFQQSKPHYVFLAAAKVGGIHANNTYPAEFIYQNTQIQNNIIHQSYLHGVTKLLFLGSSCIYPKLCPQPMKEEYLLTGELEPTNEAYAIAKIAGIKMCQSYNRQYGTNFISAMPTNLYGSNDNFDLENSHVLPAMIRKFHDAKLNGDAPVQLWGTGKPMREFLHVDDMADACLFMMQNLSTGDTSGDLYNLGTGKDVTIKNLAHEIQKIVGHKGEILWDSSKPDGTIRKLQDVNRLKNLGWTANLSLHDGLQSTYQWFLENKDSLRQV